MERPYFLSPRILSRSFSRRASVSSAESCGAHWKGVCGLGTKPPIETVQRMSF